MVQHSPSRFNSIGEYHRFRGLPAPEHPLISLINFEDITLKEGEPERMVFGFYTIALRRHPGAVFKYGQQAYDYEEGILLFMAPEQVFGIQAGTGQRLSGWLLMVHPDFFWNTHLASSIQQYDFFDYAVNEALCLTPKEEESIITLFGIIQQEYNVNIDSFSHRIIIAQLDLLLSYSERYYNRQFLTSRHSGHRMVIQLEALLNQHFEKESMAGTGIPTVQEIAGQLNISPKYLSGLLKSVTGQSTQQHIQNKLIKKAKEKLSTTQLSVSEIAYQLGFEHSQSFSKLFKAKTDMTPVEFRLAFN